MAVVKLVAPPTEPPTREERQPREAPAAPGGLRILGPIAQGGMAEVLLAVKEGAGGFLQPVAVKRLLPHLCTEARYVEMFRREARLGAVLDHPTCLKIHDALELEGRIALVMELVDGVNLRRLMLRLHELERPMPVDLACFIASQAAGALQFAHELRSLDGTPLGIVHRDVSPANVALAFAGHVKILDFGVAHAKEGPQSLTDPGRVKGKFAYMAPEAMSGWPVDRRCDIFSLGTVLWEMLAGKPAFSGAGVDPVRAVMSGELPALEHLRPDLPDGLPAVVARAMSREAHRRYPTAEAFRTALEPYLASAGEDRRLACLLDELFPPAKDPERVRVRELLIGASREASKQRGAAAPEVESEVEVVDITTGEILGAVELERRSRPIAAIAPPEPDPEPSDRSALRPGRVATALALLGALLFAGGFAVRSRPVPAPPVAPSPATEVPPATPPAPAEIALPPSVPSPPIPEPAAPKPVPAIRTAPRPARASLPLEVHPQPPALEGASVTLRLVAKSGTGPIHALAVIDRGGGLESRLALLPGPNGLFSGMVFGAPGDELRYRYEVSDGRTVSRLGVFGIRLGGKK